MGAARCHCETVGALMLRFRVPFRSKYRNVKTVRFGQVFDSRKEADRYLELRSLLERGEIKNLRRQVKYPFVLNSVKVATYIADYVYEDRYGNEIVEDVKGMKKGAAYQTFKIKQRLMLALYNIEVKEV